MNHPLLLVLPVVAFIVAYAATRQFRRYVLASGRFVDVPNARSSHVVPTPRGGGVAIVVATLAVILMLGWIGALTWPQVWALFGAGGLVALIGAWDDAGGLPRTLRLLGHFIAATWALTWMGGAPLELLGAWTRDFFWLGNAAAALFMVWFLNLTNFMDGIDGIVGVEITTVCLGGAVFYLLVGEPTSYWAGPVVLAGATLGFLVWNWPPAKIFMGDTGSGFVGIMLAAFSLQAGSVRAELFWSWLILFGVFVVDASVTFVRRMLRGDRFHEAHRSHAYQHAATMYGGHRPVTLAVAGINLIWLFPIAAAVATGVLDVRAGLLLAYVSLIVLVLWLRAGTPDARSPRVTA